MPRSRSHGARRRRRREPSRSRSVPAPTTKARGKRRRKQSPSEESSASGSSGDNRRSDGKAKASVNDSKWICAACAGPHRTKECPLSNGNANMNPLGVGMMMGMMTAPMGMPPMPGMPPMSGMPSIPRMPGVPTMPGMPPMGGPPPAGDGTPGDDPRRSKSHSRSSRAQSPSRSRERGSRRRSSVKKKEPVIIEEVEKFLQDNRINEEATLKVRAMSPASQRKLIARPLTGDVQNPSKVIIARVRELQGQNERSKSGDAWAAWSSSMMGATPEAINKYIDENDLDETASRQLRSLAPHQQAVALRWDLSKYRNPSAKFMSLANGLDPSTVPMPPFGGMMGMPGMPMMPMGMHPPMGMPTMPGMPGMPGMPSMPGMPGMPGMHGMHPMRPCGGPPAAPGAK
mmetsp:Transcript_153038/g.388838  ORF Transcript_153038/g.388838 Transcript_153038/m.388838 type:complete len:400 (-) Transcript_153038:124-1323(-)